jgi:hypothetical protein
MEIILMKNRKIDTNLDDKMDDVLQDSTMENGLDNSIEKIENALQSTQGLDLPCLDITPNSSPVVSTGIPNGNGKDLLPSLIRLSVKDGEYTYARPNDIVMIESCDHLIIVYVALGNNKVRKTVRYCSLKDFLIELPKNNFTRINRFCAINVMRLSGGNYHQQIFEFDYCISLKPKHPVPHKIFNAIGK